MDQEQDEEGEGHGQDAFVEGCDDRSQGSVEGGDGRGAADVVPGADGLEVDEVEVASGRPGGARIVYGEKGGRGPGSGRIEVCG